MKLNKKIVLAVASLGLVATMAIGGTLAYFTDTDAKKNEFVLGKVDISLIEDSNDAKAQKLEDESGIKYSDVMPGDELEKNVDVKVNEDSRDAYIAVKIDIVGDFTENDGAVAEPEVDVKAEWTEVAEGFYVYKGAEESVAAETVVDVFDTVSVPTEWTQSHDFDIEITAYAVQTENVDEATAIVELKKLAGIE